MYIMYIHTLEPQHADLFPDSSAVSARTPLHVRPARTRAPVRVYETRTRVWGAKTVRTRPESFLERAGGRPRVSAAHDFFLIFP